jgi:hypothetical protein
MQTNRYRQKPRPQCLNRPDVTGSEDFERYVIVELMTIHFNLQNFCSERYAIVELMTIHFKLQNFCSAGPTSSGKFSSQS